MTTTQTMFSGNALEACRQDARRLVELLEKLESKDARLLAECRETAGRLNNELSLHKWESAFPGYPFAK